MAKLYVCFCVPDIDNSSVVWAVVYLSSHTPSSPPGVPHGLPRSAAPAGGGPEVPAEIHGTEPARVL